MRNKIGAGKKPAKKKKKLKPIGFGKKGNIRSKIHKNVARQTRDIKKQFEELK